MKKGYRNLVLLAVLMLHPLGALAQEGHFSLAVGLGNSQFDLNEPGLVSNYTMLTSTSSFSDSVTSFSFFVGYQLDPYLSLESEFVSAGDVTATEAGLVSKLFDVSILSITVALSNQVSERIRLFGRIGTHFWNISESTGAVNTINNAVDLTYGLGVDFNVYGDRSRQLRLQWNHYEYDGVFIDAGDIISVNLLFQIGGY
ncbi:MAG: outer membrane beta-barrel protein [Proteobacteria bacterium]|nr:outer membrane beta-barrel protein [Pseudomonadota bacterium]